MSRHKNQPVVYFMNWVRSTSAFILTLCLLVSMLIAATVPVMAEEVDEAEVLSVMLNAFGVSEDVYTNYETLYNEALPTEYTKKKSSYYLALGGNTTKGYGADDYSSCYADKFKDYLGFSKDKYFNKYDTMLNSMGAVEYVKDQTELIKMSDLISFQIDSATIINSWFNRMTAVEFEELKWDDYVNDASFDDMLNEFRADYSTKYGADAVRLFECLLYECISYCVNTASAVDAIRAINPNATIVVIGLYNPLRELKIETNGKIIEVESFFDSIIDFCNVYLLDKTLKMSNVAFVDVSDAPTGGFNGTTVNLNEVDANLLFSIKNNEDAQHTNQAGHDYILNQLAASIKHHVIHKLDDGTVRKSPDCVTAGEMIYRCTMHNCTYTEVKKIEPLGHKSDVYTDLQDATCEEAGTLTAVCTVCGIAFAIENPAGPADHEYGEGGKCIYCGIKKPLGTGAIVAIVICSLAVLAGGVFGGVSLHKSKMVKNKENTDADKGISVEESVESEETTEEKASTVEQAENEEKTVADEDSVAENEEK